MSKVKDNFYLTKFYKFCLTSTKFTIPGVINFNGKDGCLKCTTVGEYSHISRTTFFPRANCPKRTDEEFRNKMYGRHHKYDSPLLELPIDMIAAFPVADCLHLLELGLMKKCLVGWKDGSFGNYKTK